MIPVQINSGGPPCSGNRFRSLVRREREREREGERGREGGTEKEMGSREGKRGRELEADPVCTSTPVKIAQIASASQV